MPRKTRRRTRKQKVINMIGCSKRCSNGRHHKSCKRSFFSKRGGQGCGSTGCPIAPLSVAKMNAFSDNYKPPIFGTKQNGGCGSCGINLMKGGTSMKGGNNFYKPAPLMPGPFVGSAWAYNKLPGMDGIGSNRNYLSPVNVGKDPALQMTMNDAGYKTMNSMIGGSGKGRKRKTVKNMKGGLMSQDLVNLGRDFTYNINTAYNALNGVSAPTKPLPYQDQLTNTATINRI
jgi:hypothetical protein